MPWNSLFLHEHTGKESDERTLYPLLSKYNEQYENEEVGTCHASKRHRYTHERFKRIDCRKRQIYDADE